MTPFFVTGGTLAPDAQSYLPRRADKELLEALQAGAFCYVLNTRQVGKSSLMIRTAHALRATGRTTLVIDITVGGFNLSPELWYDGLALQVGEQLARATQRPALEEEVENYYQERAHLGPAQRFFQLIEQIALPAAGPMGLTIFVDEIDAVRLLPFSADEFFVGIRALYNRRAEVPALSRLTFCLVGVATPSQLIHDARVSPFNIGQKITLTDFTLADTAPLASALPGGKSAIERVLYWTGGHPYLTQRLCATLAETDEAVDTAVERIFLSRAARTSDDNLAFVASRLLRGEDDLAAVLDLYGKVRGGARVPDDPTSPLCDALHLAGIVHTQPDGTLAVRNRIYSQVFDPVWVRANLPDGELRRQRAAFRRGALRMGGLASLALAALGGLTGWALLSARRADEAAYRADRETAAAVRARHVADTNRRLAESNQARAEQLARERAVALHEKERALREKGAALRAKEVALREREAALIAERRSHQLAGTARDEARSSLGQVELSLALRALANVESTTALRHLSAALTQGHLPADQQALAQYCHTALTAIAPRLRFRVACRGQVSAMLFSDDQRVLFVGTTQGWLYRFDVATGKVQGEPWFQESPVTSIAILDQERVATGDRDSRVRLWRRGQRRPYAVLVHTLTPQPIHRLVPSRDGNRLISCGQGGFVVWETRQGRELSRVWDDDIGGKWSAERPSLIASGEDAVFTDASATQLLFGAYGYVSNLADVATGKMIHGTSPPLGQPGIAPDWIYQMPPTRDGKGVALIGHYRGGSGGACIYDPKTGRALGPLMGQAAIFRCGDFSPDGTLLATGDEAGCIRFWNHRTGASESGPFTLFPARFLSELRWLPDGDRLLAQTIEGQVLIWSHKDQRVVTCRFAQERAFSLSPDGAVVATCGFDNSLSVWTIPPRKEHKLLRITISETGFHSELVPRDCFAWSTWLDPSATTESALVVDVMSRQILRKTAIGTAQINHELSPNRRYLLAHTRSNLMLWDMERQQMLVRSHLVRSLSRIEWHDREVVVHYPAPEPPTHIPLSAF